MKNILTKILTLLRKVNFHWILAYGALGVACYIRLFHLYGAIGALVLLLLLRRQIGKLDIKVPGAN
jgi:hypothetical protein